MRTISELEELIARTQLEFDKSYDDNNSFYEKKEIHQRLKLYQNELKHLQESENPRDDNPIV